MKSHLKDRAKAMRSLMPLLDRLYFPSAFFLQSAQARAKSPGAVGCTYFRRDVVDRTTNLIGSRL